MHLGEKERTKWLESIRAKQEISVEVLVAAAERGLEVLRICGELRRPALTQYLIGSLPRRWPGADVREARLELRVLRLDEKLLVSVGPHAEMARRKQFHLLVKPTQVTGSLLCAAKFLPDLLWLAYDHAFDVLVAGLLATLHDREIDRLLSLSRSRQSVADLNIGAIETVTF
jgi:hypothetical protein